MSHEPEKKSEEKEAPENAPAQETPADAGEAETAAADADAPEEKISRSVVNNLYREMKRWKEKCRHAEARAGAEKKKRREIEAEADRLRGILKVIRVDDALRASADTHGAIDPVQVAEFLRAGVALDENLEPVVVDGSGSPRLNAESEPVTLDELVHGFLSDYPHHVKAAASSGAGSAGSNGTQPDLATRIRSARTEAELRNILAAK